MKSQQSSLVTCVACKNVWETPVEEKVISATLEYKEGVTLCEQVTDYFTEGYFTKGTVFKDKLSF